METAEIILLVVICVMAFAVAALKHVSYWIERHKTPGWCLSNRHSGSNNTEVAAVTEDSNEIAWESVSEPLLAYIKSVDDDRFVGPELVIEEEKDEPQRRRHRLSALSYSPSLTDSDDYVAGTQLTRTKLAPTAFETRPQYVVNDRAREPSPSPERLLLAAERGP